MFQLWWWLEAKVLKKGLKKVWPQWNCCWLMEQDFVRYLICQWIDGNIHKRAPLHAEEETAILRPSLVLRSQAALGSKPTPWGNRVMGTLPGPRPGVCCSSGVPMTVWLQQNCKMMTGAQLHPSTWTMIDSRCQVLYCLVRIMIIIVTSATTAPLKMTIMLCWQGVLVLI